MLCFLHSLLCIFITAAFSGSIGSLGFSFKSDFSGPPLTHEEFIRASSLQENYEEFADFEFVREQTNDDIIKSSVVKNSYLFESSLWPNGVVPYLLDEKYDEKGRLLIARAFQEFQNKTCVKFIPKSSEEDYIIIVKDKGCSSYIGRLGDAQPVILGSGCYSLGIMMHELMHTLGFIHEHSRDDRDKYVSVLWENIKEGRADNFRIWSWYSDRILQEKYDYSSILHYHSFTFSKSPSSKPTLIPKKKGEEIGQKKFLSEGDIRKITTAYRCKT